MVHNEISDATTSGSTPRDRIEDDAVAPIVETATAPQDLAWELVLRRLPALVWTTDADLRITSAGGAAFGELTGPAPGLVGRAVAEWFGAGREGQAPLSAHQAALDGQPSSLEHIWRRKAYRLYIEPLASANGQSRGTIGMAIDVTPRRHTEDLLNWTRSSLCAPNPTGDLANIRQRLKTEVEERRLAEETLRESLGRFFNLASGAESAIWVYDLSETRVIFLSPAYERIWGVSVDEALSRPGHAIWRQVYEEDVDRVTEMNLRQRQGQPISEEFRIRRPDGETRWILARAFPIHGATGRPERIAGIAEDITNQKQEEERSRRSERLATLGNFAAGIAHEINNPLGAALASTQAAVQLGAAMRLSAREPNPLLAECLETALTSVRRCSEIVKSLLRFCREEPGRRVIFDAREVMGFAESITRAYATDHQCRLIASPGEEPLAIEGNQIELEIVLVNLLRNAIESGAANVTLSALVTASEIEINVADDGCGVAEADAHRLCDPFFTTRRSRGGAGLGLSITHSIIQEHGGRLDFVRTSGPGVTVRVILPRVFDERESDDVGST